ncbi:hypothetical protein Dsin_000309 [Dipteronia sinensis]|uniref:RNase H type-1 domain-containing protein n=1 Tax=Dipteronia sinensis TaxID=43782 RepID=A0AAE0EHA9_9ROSI|nr:hypothetical protein Dsin_000309 [Dipteronia sinensis]
MVDWVRSFLSDYKECASKLISTPRERIPVDNIWRPQDIGLYKVNCDAAVNVSTCTIGIGIVIRDSTGFVLVACSQKKIVASYFAQLAETVAILKGFQFAKDCGLTPFFLESDAVVVVKWINEGSHFNLACGVILSDISKLSLEMGGISIKHIPRLTNNVANGHC